MLFPAGFPGLISAPAASQSNFSPSDLANLLLWLDASDEDTITESAGAVSQWDDKSGNNNHLTQSTANDQMTTGTRTLNGLNALDGDGSEFMDVNNISVSSSLTIMIIAEFDGGLTNNEGLFSLDASNDFQYESSALSSGNFHGQFRATGLGPGTVGELATDRSGPAVYALRLDATAGTIELFYDDMTTPYATDATYNGNLSATQDFILFANRGRSQFFNGIIGELCFYNQALTDQELGDLKVYLADKWSGTFDGTFDGSFA